MSIAVHLRRNLVLGKELEQCCEDLHDLRVERGMACMVGAEWAQVAAPAEDFGWTSECEAAIAALEQKAREMADHLNRTQTNGTVRFTLDEIAETSVATALGKRKLTTPTTRKK